MAVILKSGSGARIATCLMACAILVAGLTLIIPRSVSANAGLSIVHGTVTDSAGRPIEGANVVVVMWNGATMIDTTSTQTLSNGLYIVNFALDKWAPGFTVNVTATYNQVQTSGGSTVDDLGLATINLQFPFEIPQFGSMLGFVAAAGLVGVVAVVFLARKSK